MTRREDGLWYAGSHRIRWLPLAALLAVVTLTGALMVVALKANPPIRTRSTAPAPSAWP